MNKLIPFIALGLCSCSALGIDDDIHSLGTDTAAEHLHARYDHRPDKAFAQTGDSVTDVWASRKRYAVSHFPTETQDIYVRMLKNGSLPEHKDTRLVEFDFIPKEGLICDPASYTTGTNYMEYWLVNDAPIEMVSYCHRVTPDHTYFAFAPRTYEGAKWLLDLFENGKEIEVQTPNYHFDMVIQPKS